MLTGAKMLERFVRGGEGERQDRGVWLGDPGMGVQGEEGEMMREKLKRQGERRV